MDHKEAFYSLLSTIGVDPTIGEKSPLSLYLTRRGLSSAGESDYQYAHVLFSWAQERYRDPPYTTIIRMLFINWLSVPVWYDADTFGELMRKIQEHHPDASMLACAFMVRRQLTDVANALYGDIAQQIREKGEAA